MDISKTCLVIDSRNLRYLGLDGPALAVALRGQSIRLFPLRRLSRVHVIGSRSLSQGFDALLNCAEHQIPVAFFTHHGKLRCQLYYPVYEHRALSHWLEHVEFDPQAKDEYSQWYEHQRLHLLSQLGCQQGDAIKRQHWLQEQINKICHQLLSKEEKKQASDWLEGMLCAHLSQMIVQQGLANQSRGKRRLMEDLQPICQLWLMTKLVLTITNGRRLKIDGSGMSQFYQYHSEQIEYIVQRMLTQLITRLELII